MKIFDHHVDVVFEVQGYRILLDLVYKGKPPIIIEEEKLQANNAALLALDCDSFSMSILKNDRRLRFSESVLAFLLRDGLRRWQFHPKTASALHKASEVHRCTRMAFPSGRASRDSYRFARETLATPEVFETHVPDMVERKPTCYQCVICGTKWMHDFNQCLICPNGHGHLYAKEVG